MHESSSVMAVVEINLMAEEHHISNRKCHNSHTITEECRQTIVCIVMA
jgi:hypothetical protein